MLRPGARQAAFRPAKMRTQPKSVPAPVAGWVSAQNLAAQATGTAIELINWFPTLTGCVVRGGNTLHATIDTTPDPVESMMAYIGGSIRELFAAAAGSIYNITSVADPEVPPAADVTGQTADYYAHANFATTGGNYMYAVNGADLARLYDGSTWTAINGVSTPAITGVTTSTFSHVNVYRNRLYFVESGTMFVWYLPVDSIGGAASSLNMAGIFRKGGAAFFTATWSMDAGDGLDDKMVVVSTEGEAAVFQGADPGAADWTLVGVYDISPPLGINAWMRAGGDLVILTEQGMVPISAAVTKDPAALALDAVSRKIEPDWVQTARARRLLPWEIAKWDSKSAFYINTPIVSDAQSELTFVGNLKSGAWAKYTGWDTRCVIIHDDQLYFGCNDGTIRLAEVSGYDLDQPYTAQMALAWDHLGLPGAVKSLKQARAELRARADFAYRISASTNYAQTFPVAPNPLPDTSSPGEWDVGQWDVALWDTGSSYFTTTTRWVSIGVTGDVFSVEFQIPVGNATTPSAELAVIHLLFEQGGIAV